MIDLNATLLTTTIHKDFFLQLPPIFLQRYRSNPTKMTEITQATNPHIGPCLIVCSDKIGAEKISRSTNNIIFRTTLLWWSESKLSESETG